MAPAVSGIVVAGMRGRDAWRIVREDKWTHRQDRDDGTIHEQQDEVPGVLVGLCLPENLEAFRI
jgi:hypothetical protein